MELCSDATPVYGLGNNAVPIAGAARLPVYFSKKPKQAFHLVKFYVTNFASMYNMILGRPILNLFRAITLIAHLKIKFPPCQGRRNQRRPGNIQEMLRYSHAPGGDRA